MVEIRSSEASVLTGIMRRHMPEDGILHSHRRENLKPYRAFLFPSVFFTVRSSLASTEGWDWVHLICWQGVSLLHEPRRQMTMRISMKWELAGEWKVLCLIDLIWNWTRAASVRTRPLVSWAVTQPGMKLTLSLTSVNTSCVSLYCLRQESYRDFQPLQ
jgi:hypothetical protein